MRKILTFLTLFLIPYLSLAAEKLKIAATPVPQVEILEFVKPLLKEKDIDLEIITVTDYVMPNIMLADGEVDANYMQHQPYLDDFNAGNQLDLVSVGAVHVEPFGAYSQKIKSIDELGDRAKVSLPNDPSNEGRALLLLHHEGIITLKDVNNILANISDIKENPKKLKFLELDAAMLSHTLDEVDLALINTNFALDANLKPTEDALLIEGKDSPYANVIVVRPENKNDEKIKVLVDLLNSDDVRQFIEEKYDGAIVPSF